jgi:hypothetical protein
MEKSRTSFGVSAKKLAEPYLCVASTPYGFSIAWNPRSKTLKRVFQGFQTPVLTRQSLNTDLPLSPTVFLCAWRAL